MILTIIAFVIALLLLVFVGIIVAIIETVLWTLLFAMVLFIRGILMLPYTIYRKLRQNIETTNIEMEKNNDNSYW